MNRNIWVYDLEIFCNFFSCVAINIDTLEVKYFVLMKDVRNDLQAFYEWLLTPGMVMVGYNNLDFDYQLLHVVLTLVQADRNVDLDVLITALYRRTQELVNHDTPRFHKKLIPEWKMLITQIDLYKISHFDNKARATSLKWLEFAMRMENVQDLPKKHNLPIEPNEVQDVLDYNYNDVEATFKYLKQIMKAIDLRANICNEYNLSVMNANDVKIGVEIFAKELASNMSISKRELKELSTNREYIDLADCILPYVTFQSPAFNAILEFLKRQRITETKGVFSDLPIDQLGDAFIYAAKSELKFENGKVKTKSLIKNGTLDKLNTVHEGFQYDFGTGGIHGCIDPGVYVAEDGYIIVDVDVASYYPNLAIENGFKPEHLGDNFCEVYKSIYLKRKTYPKSNPNNAALKLALNGVYGKSNSKHSFLYDPKFTMSITINGQLLLCMLAEQITYGLHNCTMLQINTDGMTVKIPEQQYDRLKAICKEWEQLTKLTLEYVNYERMIIRDVNNYIGVYGPGKYKHKGTFEIDRAYHKNHSRRVVPIALHNYFVHNIPIAQTIRQHVNGADFSNGEFDNYGIFDYCIAKKASSNYQYQKRYVDQQGFVHKEAMNDKIVRYFVSNRGVIVSKMDKQRLDEESYTGAMVEAHPQRGKSFYVNTFNQYVQSEIYDLNYEYYIRECNKIVNTIENNFQQTLF